MEISSQSISVDDNNIGLIDRDLVTMSYNDAENVNVTKGSDLFSLTFIADKSGLVSDMIKLTSMVTVNEAYIGNDYELHEVELRFNEAQDVLFSNKLYQNEPNPFRKRTTIGFDLAAQSEVKLTILNSTGSVIRVISIEGEKGHNTYVLNANQVGVNGLYYYKLECEGFLDTKKMILVK